MQSWTEIKKIENPTEEQQLEAVKLNWYAISLIENPTPAVQKAAQADKRRRLYRPLYRLYFLNVIQRIIARYRTGITKGTYPSGPR